MHTMHWNPILTNRRCVCITTSITHGYVTGLNNAEAKLADARAAGDFSAVKHLSREAAFHGSGHLLHSIFWPNMMAASEAKAAPEGALAEAIDRDFGSFEAFKAQFVAASIAVEGSGWGILAFRPADGALVVLTAEKHQNLTQWGVFPCWYWTSGSTPTTSSTRTAAASMSRTFSTSSTGTMLPLDLTPPAAKREASPVKPSSYLSRKGNTLWARW